jgi:hypothetical protein
MKLKLTLTILNDYCCFILCLADKIITLAQHLFGKLLASLGDESLCNQFSLTLNFFSAAIAFREVCIHIVGVDRQRHAVVLTVWGT